MAQQVLVLNATYEPINVCSLQRAVVLVLKNKAEVLERAARKLRMGAVDITEVALAAGYDSHAAFSKAFKQQFGLSPSEFRQLGCWAATQLLAKG